MTDSRQFRARRRDQQDYLHDGEFGIINRSGNLSDVQDVLDKVTEQCRTLFLVEQDTDDPDEIYAEQHLKKVAVVLPYDKYRELYLGETNDA
jgi:hypothetical protein